MDYGHYEMDSWGDLRIISLGLSGLSLYQALRWISLLFFKRDSV